MQERLKHNISEAGVFSTNDENNHKHSKSIQIDDNDPKMIQQGADPLDNKPLAARTLDLDLLIRLNIKSSSSFSSPQSRSDVQNSPGSSSNLGNFQIQNDQQVLPIRKPQASTVENEYFRKMLCQQRQKDHRTFHSQIFCPQITNQCSPQQLNNIGNMQNTDYAGMISKQQSIQQNIMRQQMEGSKRFRQPSPNMNYQQTHMKSQNQVKIGILKSRISQKAINLQIQSKVSSKNFRSINELPLRLSIVAECENEGEFESGMITRKNKKLNKFNFTTMQQQSHQQQYLPKNFKAKQQNNTHDQQIDANQINDYQCRQKKVSSFLINVNIPFQIGQNDIIKKENFDDQRPLDDQIVKNKDIQKSTFFDESEYQMACEETSDIQTLLSVMCDINDKKSCQKQFSEIKGSVINPKK